METYESLLEKLSNKGVKFILVGGLAVDLCGFERATMDVDIIVQRSEENIVALIEALKQFGDGSARELSFNDFDLEEGCVRVIEDFPVDIFTIMKGNTYEDLIKYKVVFKAESGVEIPHLNADGLILLKQESARSKDQIDVNELKKGLGRMTE